MSGPRRLPRWYQGALWAFLVAFGLFLVFSNHDDWDQFLTGFEVDLRSWLIDGRAPFWSYQLCAGSPRAGDPQSFGLSPLFLPILLFGSFWGAKALALLSTVVGYFSVSGILSLVGAAGGEGGTGGDAESAPGLRFACSSLALFFVSGNYFLWHLHAGQLTFTLFYWAFACVYWALRLLRGPWGWRPAFALFACLFAYETGGFYHSFVFFVAPFGLLTIVGAAVHLALTRRRPSRAALARAAATGGVALAATVAAAYRWLPVFRYQQAYPRSVAGAAFETNSLSHLFLYFYAPTWNLKLAGRFEFLDVWGFYEYSALSFLSVLLPAGLLWLLCRHRGGGRQRLTALWVGPLFVSASLAVLFSLGDSSPVPIHTWLNHLLYHDSVRVVGRYHVLILAAAAVFLARLVAIEDGFRRFYLRYLVPAGLVFVAASLFTFLPELDAARFRSFAFSALDARAQMDALVVVPPRIIGARGDSFMYQAARLGGIVLNCYQPMNRGTHVAREDGFESPQPSLRARVLPLLNPGKLPLSERCRASAYVTQNEVFYDRQACPPGLCFNLNMLDPWGKSDLRLDPQRRLYCSP